MHHDSRLSRRSLLGAGAASFMVPDIILAQSRPPEFDTSAVDGWHQEWSSARVAKTKKPGGFFDLMVDAIETITGPKPQSLPPKGPDGALVTGRFGNAYWYLYEPISWSPREDDPKHLPAISVPRGFVTDYASIPSKFWSVYPRDGDYVWPAVVHDYLYWMQTTSREDADLVFKQAMLAFKVSQADVFVIYNIVAAAGGWAWDRNAKLKQAGEKRVLAKFPPQPTITWEEWKAQPDVFATTG